MRPIPDGLEVRVEHRRPPAHDTTGYRMSRHELRGVGEVPHTKGGFTRATLLNDAGQPLATGLAFCGPNDNFNRRIGRAIAIGRAVKNYEDQQLAEMESELTA